MPETVTKFANLQTLEKLLTLIKVYVDGSDSKKMDSFTPGEGLSLEGGILKVTLDTTLFKVVESLPTAPAASDANKIFLVRDSSSKASGNVYVEYMYVNEAWEEVGRQQVEVDLGPYLKKNELTATVGSSSISIQKGSEKLAEVAFNASDFQGVNGAGSLNVSLKDILEASVPSGMYKLAIDKKGRVTGYTAIQLSDLTALGVAKQADLETTNQNLANEVKDRQDAIQEVNSTITTTKEALEAADQALGGRIDTTNSNLETEQTTRQTEDGKLQQAINTVASNLETESQARATGDTQAIASATEAAQGLVNSEKTARENADAALNTRTTALENALADRPIITSEEVTTIFNEVYSEIEQPM